MNQRCGRQSWRTSKRQLNFKEYNQRKSHHLPQASLQQSCDSHSYWIFLISEPEDLIYWLMSGCEEDVNKNYKQFFGKKLPAPPLKLYLRRVHVRFLLNGFWDFIKSLLIKVLMHTLDIKGKTAAKNSKLQLLSSNGRHCGGASLQKDFFPSIRIAKVSGTSVCLTQEWTAQAYLCNCFGWGWSPEVSPAKHQNDQSVHSSELRTEATELVSILNFSENNSSCKHSRIWR